MEGDTTFSATRKSSIFSDTMDTTASSGSSNNLSVRAFAFEKKSNYDATNELIRLRDSNFRIRPPSKDDDIWKRPPPDFRPQCFEPKPPKRNSREAMKPWKYDTEGEKDDPLETSGKRQEKLALPELLKPKVAEVIIDRICERL